MDITSALDLVFKVASEQPVTTTISDVRDLIGDYQSAKSGKLTLSGLTKTQAITALQEAVRTETLILHLIQDKAAGDANFAEIKSLAGSVG